MTGKTTCHLLATAKALLLFLALVSPAHASLLFADFSSTAGLTLNGFASSVNNGIDPNPVLRLAGAATSTSGSAFSTSAMNISSFSTTFAFRISAAGGVSDVSGESGADGLTFTIQTAGPTALGGGGGGFGYSGLSPSVAVELDTFNNDPVNFPIISDPDSNHLGIDTNGSLQSLATAAVPGRFDSGTFQSASISYDGTTLSVSSGATLLSLAIDIPTLLGTSSAFVGLTAATGAAVGNHDIIAWSFQPTAVPEPITVALSGLGLAMIGVASRRRRTAARRMQSDRLSIAT